MRPPASFHTSFLLSTWVSFAFHAAVIGTGFWLHREPAPRTLPKPVFDHGENAVTIVWRSPAPKDPAPEVDPEPDAASEPETPDVEPEPESAPETAEIDPEPEPESEAPPPAPSREPPVAVSIPPRSGLVRESRTTRESSASPPDEPRAVPVSSTRLAAPAAALPSLVENVPEEPPSEGKPGVREEARLASRLAPRYPRSCRRRGHEGTVRLACRLSPAGRVTTAAVVESSGCDELDGAALDAVRAARFTPQRIDGRPVAGTIVLPIEFRLR